ncbi:hypothetical protein SAMN04489716_3485 [Actinoplanes derwentensis]|uniref:Beta/Gamma crystallin n=2 Tax=Actinoplanes derwentensis TaxID=113562 RepID=A0A1H1ZTC3_9ACTN|nr:hypothetical protein Ade03nite_24840 [Actinoplanes derwentensis]SDT36903.1 hypothetical protein SAMN04489716_3485 [Actinoplanes derwentensis]
MVKRVIGAVTTAVALTAAAVVVNPGSAAAAMGKGRVQICSKGTYQSWLEFEGGLEYQATYLAAPGKCIAATIPSGTYAIKVWAIFDATKPLKWPLTRFGASTQTDPGVKVFTYGNNILDQSFSITT